MKKLLILLFLPVQLAFAQQPVTLEECYQLTRENYPNLKKAELFQEISMLNKENISTNHLPQVSLNGQATYQSDVTKVDISMPNVSVPSVSKDQYKAYAEFRQSIWDGGLTAANQQLEDAVLKSNLSELEVELYKLNEQVTQAFFTILAMKQQNEVLEAQKKVLQEKLRMVQSGIRNQTVEKSAAFSIEAEIITLEQNELQLETGKDAALKMLSILTGEEITSVAESKLQKTETGDNAKIVRPELQLFSNQMAQMETQKNLLDKKRNPKMFGFGQAGYGKPGLNMLSDKFDTYYLVGVGVSWNPFDWKQTERQKQVLQLRQEMVQQQENTFSQNIQLLLAQQSGQIEKLKKMLEKDEKLVELKTAITKATASKLKNGTINSADFVRDVQAETIAKLNRELHDIQLKEAIEKQRIIQGKVAEAKVISDQSQ
ncbi:Outer membrane protein TolC [Tangfeifania diversioriginum]|uniref:Outer membrane protein TolC n=1 Tax=Tangfeifania diversioriginum TaxID=1168035 RepID=A0A1M6ETG8_9BACT|nr:TolC family protein [Tangfeifania diversioriginum]SHI88708.1 Outer membrane protein TolC [Tangfeifania diversioriginum]